MPDLVPSTDTEKLLIEAQQRLLALEQSQALLLQQQDTLLHSLSHDLRTPAMTILGFTDLLLADHGNSPDPLAVRQYLEHVRNSANRQVGLITALIEFCKLSQQPFDVAATDLSALAAEHVKQRPDLDTLTDTQFVLQPTPIAQGDQQLLRQLMYALLDNAIKFTRRSSHPVIRFGVETGAAQPVYFLHDNGAGFNAERQDRLFRPFSRLHSSKDYPGIGMGLASAALIVQRHQGRIWAAASADQGTIIRFTLGGN
jgi:signal transduction histidine kinase